MNLLANLALSMGETLVHESGRLRGVSAVTDSMKGAIPLPQGGIRKPRPCFQSAGFPLLFSSL